MVIWFFKNVKYVWIFIFWKTEFCSNLYIWQDLCVHKYILECFYFDHFCLHQLTSRHFYLVKTLVHSWGTTVCMWLFALIKNCHSEKHISVSIYAAVNDLLYFKVILFKPIVLNLPKTGFIVWLLNRVCVL